MTEILLGDEAVARAAIDAGIGGAFSYPGTPATEIFEHIQQHALEGGSIVARWSANEKVAYEEALGMSYAGRRAIVSMKHVGLNVAADPFMSSALTGVNAGVVLAVADDPGMHSSQNEQDSRFYADFAQIPLFEPSDQQEAYDMTLAAFEASERFQLPVMVRLVTRLAHSRANVRTRARIDTVAKTRATDWHQWTLLPPNARKQFGRLLKLQTELECYSENSPFNKLTLRGPQGVIITGLANNYFEESYSGDHSFSVLKLGVYPTPADLVRKLVDHCERITVIEEGYPFVERRLRGYLGIPGKELHGKLDGTLPPQGELTTEIVRTALSGDTGAHHAPLSIPGRPPQLCHGCPHCDAFQAIVEAVDKNVRPFLFSDIGCYSLGALPPFNAVDACVDMGASISMAIGAAKAGAHPVVATIGDSTFIHSGMSALVEAAHDDVNITVVILDNALIAMTGGQEVLATGDNLMRVIRGLGVTDDHLIALRPLAHEHVTNVELIRREIEHRGLSVIVAQRPCIHAKSRAREAVVSVGAASSIA